MFSYVLQSPHLKMYKYIFKSKVAPFLMENISSNSIVYLNKYSSLVLTMFFAGEQLKGER